MSSFETQNLKCRLLADSDREYVASLYTCESRMKHIGDVVSEAKALSIVDRMLKCNASQGRSAYWAIEEKTSGELIGIQNIQSVPKLLSVGEIGIMLFRQGEGKYYPHEALTGMFSHIFLNMEIDIIVESHDVTNIAINRISKRLGFVPSGTYTDCGKNKQISILTKKNWFR